MRRALTALALAGLATALYSSLQLLGTGPRREGASTARSIPTVAVEGQPLAANIERLAAALEFLGAPLPTEVRANLVNAGQARDSQALQQLLDGRVLLSVHINPESRVRVERGPAPAQLQQAGYTPVIVKVVNESGGTQRLRIGSPQAGPVYAGMARLSADRMQQQHLRENENVERRTDRFLDLELFTAAPMTANLSGLELEYVIALIYSSESGRREATITFDVGQGTQDPGFRAEAPVLFTVEPAVAVRLGVLDHDGHPTTGRFQFEDRQGHVFPPQAKRLAPDLFFQKQIYRVHGEEVLLPPGQLTMFYGRGPEYRWIKQAVTIPEPGAGASGAKPEIAVRLERWIDPSSRGYFSGDHHIHAAGCAHYTSPTEGVEPSDMFRQIKGEGLNVGSVLTWGPGFDHQKQFFAPLADQRSEPKTLMKYDIEVSGFGSEALGHVCLINLKEQIYPGADGSKNWPTWTLPVLRWTKSQGGVGGYAHSGSGLQIDPEAATGRLIDQLDIDRNGRLDSSEAARGLLPERFADIDTDRDGTLGAVELKASHDRADDQLPNYAIPELNSVGAQEIFVTAAHRVVDFISAMDTDRIREWNAWYHLLNVGFPLKAGGETDFPCMSGTRVGQGRTYVHLGSPSRVEYAQWAQGVRQGRSYVSDGYAHALGFTVDGKPSGDELQLAAPRTVTVKAVVAFSPETPLEPVYGGAIPVGGRRYAGDTVIKREALSVDPLYKRARRLVEVAVNGLPVAEPRGAGRWPRTSARIPGVDRTKQLDSAATVPATPYQPRDRHRGWQARAGVTTECAMGARRGRSALARRSRRISAAERADAERAYDEARAIYRQIAAESPADR